MTILQLIVFSSNSKLKFTRTGYVAEILDLVEVITAPHSDFSNLFRSTDEKPEPLNDLKIDFRTSKYLANLSKEKIHNYPTTWEEDAKIMEEDERKQNEGDPSVMTLHQKLAVKIRMAEKEIFYNIGSHFLNKAERILKQLQHKPTEDEL